MLPRSFRQYHLILRRYLIRLVHLFQSTLSRFVLLGDIFIGHKKLYVYHPQRSWGKVMFLQASVILLTGGRGAFSRGVSAPGGELVETPPGRLLLRTIRILLECILVLWEIDHIIAYTYGYGFILHREPQAICYLTINVHSAARPYLLGFSWIKRPIFQPEFETIQNSTWILLSQIFNGYLSKYSENEFETRQHSSRMRTARLPTVCVSAATTRCKYPPGEQTDTCENITFPKLRLRAVIN